MRTHAHVTQMYTQSHRCH